MQGCYSDRHVVAVTANKEKAEKLLKEINFCLCYGNKAEIEVYDDAVMIDNRKMYIAKFDINYNFEDVVQYYDDLYVNEEYKIASYFPNRVDENTFCDGKCSIIVKADSEEHAKKIACDIMAEYRYKNECGE